METNMNIISHNYFCSLNNIAEKIVCDIENIRKTYQNTWHTFNRNEQNHIINENIINPSIISKYSDFEVIDISKENSNIHTWFTKSQLNLINLDEDNHSNMYSNILVNINNEPTSIQNEFHKNDYQKNKNTAKFSEQIQFPVVNKIQLNANMHKCTVLKPKTPPPPPPVKTLNANTSEEVTLDVDLEQKYISNIRKTGFDFLDNW